MAKITLKGNEVNTNSDIVSQGSDAPDFILVNSDLQDVNLSSFDGKNKILSIVPSLDTPVCQKSTLVFNEKVAGLEDTVMLIVSSDLPFAMKRFCTNESLDNVMPVSMMRSRNFAKDYGVLLVDGPLSGITTRAIVTISKDNKVLHSELVTEIADEPNYQAALDSIK
ncbi:thiol peroxidase [Gammaproteobacteria bacterium]|jgi:thiol peroxidase|nr:thiol peroxidase [Gammaproteobacteria bacterium]MDC0985079.1 thiol peroxidase [Gammaproteobacteria bacterium]|tara:strand:- start:195 stop:695 length:501 start_codon:yes stop_codon:yes gene_type:complete